jgi:hypothetical protein
MKIVKTRACNKVRQIKSLISKAGNQMFSVHFIKKSNGELRKMSCRLHVRKPTYSESPNGTKRINASDYDNLIVFDCNKILHNKKGKMNGRGAYRTVPLMNVVRVKVNGEIYKFV